MITHKRYNFLVALFPIVYLIHNIEEWLLFSRKIDAIAELSPGFIKEYVANNSTSILAIFGIGIIVATLIPFVVSLVIWNKPCTLNLKLLIIIAFATFINGLSHVSSSLALGIVGPGLITGILLCFPFSVLVITKVRQSYRFSVREYSLLGLLSIMVYILAIALSWVIGIGVYKLIG